MRSTEGERENEPVQQEATVQESTLQEPTSREETSNIILRVSGTEGVEYEGTYSTREESHTVEGIVGSEPTDYDANVKGVDKANFVAVFRKTQPSEGVLRGRLVADGQVIADSATSAQLGEVTLKWPSQEETEPKGTTLPGEP